MSEKIEVFRIKFKSTNDLLVEAKDYRKFGSFLEFAKNNAIDINDRVRSYFEFINISDFPKSEWSG